MNITKKSTFKYIALYSFLFFTFDMILLIGGFIFAENTNLMLKNIFNQPYNFFIIFIMLFCLCQFFLMYLITNKYELFSKIISTIIIYSIFILLIKGNRDSLLMEYLLFGNLIYIIATLFSLNLLSNQSKIYYYLFAIINLINLIVYFKYLQHNIVFISINYLGYFVLLTIIYYVIINSININKKIWKDKIFSIFYIINILLPIFSIILLK